MTISIEWNVLLPRPFETVVIMAFQQTPATAYPSMPICSLVSNYIKIVLLTLIPRAMPSAPVSLMWFQLRSRDSTVSFEAGCK